MAEKPKLQSDVIVPAETCRNEDGGFFERPTKEFELCKLENKVAEFQEFMRENPNASVIELLKKSPIIDSKDIAGTQYDALEYFEKPPVIGMISGGVNAEETEYLTFQEIHGKKYKDMLFTTDPVESSANGIFIKYNEFEGILTTFHSGYGFLRSSKTDKGYPNHRFEQIQDILFMELDNVLLSHISPSLRKRLGEVSSVVLIPSENIQIEPDISGTIGYDEGGNFSEKHKGMKSRTGVPFEVTQELEEQIIGTLLKEYEEERKRYHSEYSGEKLNKALKNLEIGIHKVRGERGVYVGKYIYRISKSSYIHGAGVSGSPLFQKGQFIGIHKAVVKISGMYFSVFTPINQIEDKVLSKIQ